MRGLVFHPAGRQRLGGIVQDLLERAPHHPPPQGARELPPVGVLDRPGDDGSVVVLDAAATPRRADQLQVAGPSEHTRVVADEVQPLTERFREAARARRPRGVLEQQAVP